MGQQLESGEVVSFVSTVRLVSFLPRNHQLPQNLTLSMLPPQLHDVAVSSSYFFLRIWSYMLLIVRNGVPSTTLHVEQNGAQGMSERAALIFKLIGV